MHAMKDTESESLSTDYSDLEYDSSENHIDIYSPESIELNGLHHSSLCIRNALYSGLLPSLIKDCTGGTYMCYDSYNHVKAVFKPCDEEPYCIHNPKGLLPDCFLDNNRGINPGTSYLREVIAYFLDYDHFAGVPETTLASIAYHQENDYNMCYKEGSLQVFIPHECSSEDYGSSLYSLENVQRIALLDLRLFNLDRHENNLLVCNISTNSRNNSVFHTSSSLHLVPIDHGYALPCKTTHALPEWCWLYWKQSQMPLNQVIIDYVNALDIDNDISLIKTYLPSIEESSLDTLRITTLWLKLCAKKSMSLSQIASFFFPKDNNEESPFQILVALYTTQFELSGIPFTDFLSDVGLKYMRSILASVCAYHCLL